MRRALVFGGTGVVGREVLRGLASRGVPAVFTYHRSRQRAEELAAALGQQALAVDLADPAATAALVRSLQPPPDVLIHCAAAARVKPFADVTPEDWQTVQAVNCQSAFVACQALLPHLKSLGRGDVVLVGALERTQSLPIPPHFAASQGMQAALVMALAREMGPAGVRVNLVALGPLEDGLSRELSPKLLDDYQSFSALHRRGTPAEAARAILWLALENSYMSGKVLPVNGGI